MARLMKHRFCAARAARAALTLGAMLGLGYGTCAWSQDVRTDGAAEDTIAEVLVTGSRLARPDLTAPSPTTVVTEDDLRSSGNVTVENTLNEFPQLASGNTSSVNYGGGSGVLTANLRGLGATRTLVLVNGRRFIPANSDGTVDLTTIPDALVSRVDIITGGASAIYGSDAIAGAVNFVLKDDFDGVETSYQYGQTSEGDGGFHKADITLGLDLAQGRGNAVLSASYTEREPVFMGERDFSAVPVDGLNGQFVPIGSSYIPGGRIALTAQQRAALVGVNMAPGGACTAVTSVRFDAGGTPQAYCSPEDTYNFAPLNYLLRPLQRVQISSLGHYAFTDNIEGFVEAFYFNTRNEYQQAPAAFDVFTPGADAATLRIPGYATNPVLLAPVRQFFVDNSTLFDPDGDGTAEVVGMVRRAQETGPRNYAYERASYAYTTGLRGTLDLFERDWRWETFYQFQRTRTDERVEGLISLTRLGLGLDAAIDPSGQVTCRTQILGCVPVSPFGIGSITPEAGAFIAPPRESSETFERQIAGASLSGALADLPAGPLATAVGMEYRSDKYDFNPSALDLAGEYGPPFVSAIAGDYDVWEVFAEARVPILSGAPLAERLAIEGAVRYSEYATIEEVFTWRAALEWAPTQWLAFRTAYNRAIRAPTLNELFSPALREFATAADPCAALNLPTPQQKQFCVDQGVPAAEIDTFVDDNETTVAVLTGGNRDLKEEESETITVGTVITPAFAPRLNIAIDYFDISIEGAVAAINAQQALQDCYTRLDGSSATCRAVQRLPSGQVDFVAINLQNVGSLEVRGVDAQIDYSFALPSFLALRGNDADLKVQVGAGWLFERSTQTVRSQAPIDCAGRFGGGCTGTGVFSTPDFKLNIAALWRSGPASVRLQGRSLGSLDVYPGIAAAAVTRTEMQWYVDLSTTVRLFDFLELFGGVDNVLDNDPPILGQTLSTDPNTDPSLYDTIGRRFFVGSRLRF